MAEKTAGKKVTYDQVSGQMSTDAGYAKIHGGVPDKKGVEAIEKETTPKRAPGSCMSGS